MWADETMAFMTWYFLKRGDAHKESLPCRAAIVYLY